MFLCRRPEFRTPQLLVYLVVKVALLVVDKLLVVFSKESVPSVDFVGCQHELSWATLLKTLVFQHLNLLSDEGDVVQLQEVSFTMLQQSQRDFIDGWPSLEEEQVEHRHEHLIGQVASEEGHEPVARQHLQVELQLFEMVVQFWQLCFDQLTQHVVAQVVLGDFFRVKRLQALLNDQSNEEVEGELLVSEVREKR